MSVQGEVRAFLAIAFGFAVLFAVPANGAPRVYSADTINPGTIRAFDAVGDGSLRAGPTFSTVNTERALWLLPSPDGRWLFSIGNDGSIATLAIAADGSLSRRSSLAAGVFTTFPPAISPDGRSLYSVGPGTSSIQQWTIGDDGTVTAKTPATISLGNLVRSLALSPSGRSLFASAPTGIQRLNVAADGTLTLAGSPIGPPGSFSSLAVATDGRSLYAASSGSPGFIGQWSISSDETLTSKTPATLASAGFAPDVIGLTPFGRGVYALPIGQVEQFTVGPSGALAPLVPPMLPVTQQRAIASSPDGRSLYVARTGAINEYDVASNGQLTAKTPSSVLAGAAVDLVSAPSQGPRAELSVPQTIAAGGSVGFDASASSTPGGVVDRYDWDFGDGATEADAGATPFHAYAAPGNYTVSVTVTDGSGCSTGLYNGRYTLCRDRGAVATASVLVTAPAADLRLAKAVNTPSVAAGEQFTYTLRVANGGPTDATGTTLRDAIPRGLTIDAIEPSQGDCALDAGTAMTCALGTLRENDSALVLIFARAGAELAGSSITNAADVTSSAPESDPVDNHAEVTLAVTAEAGEPQPRADVVVEKSVAPASAQIDRPIAYTVRVANLGRDIARNVTVVDSYDGGGALVGVDAGGADCDPSPVLVCRLGDMRRGETAVIVLQQRPQEPGEARNEVSVVSDSEDVRPGNNVDSVPKAISSRRARLALSVRPAYRQLTGGSTQRFSLRVRSLGADAARATVVCVRPPAGLEPVRTGGATVGSTRLCWRIERLAAGRSQRFAFTARAKPVARARRLTVDAFAASLDARDATARAVVRVLAREPRRPRVTG